MLSSSGPNPDEDPRPHHGHRARPPDRSCRRPLSPRARARPRGHGDRLPRRGPEAPPPGRHQGARPRARRLDRRRPLPPRDRGHRPYRPPAHSPPPRLGRSRGLFYYVMPYVEGESLRDRLDREKQLPFDEALQIARQVADALGYAHGRGIVHRDIKPENILLSAGHARVADFG